MNGNPDGPPSPVDYGKAKTVVIQETLQSKPVLLATGSGLLGGLALGVLGVASPLVAGLVAAGGVVAGTVLWVSTYALRRDRLEHEYREKLHKRFDEIRIARLDRLEQSLGEAVECVQGKEQVDQFALKFQTLKDVIARKLSPQELTYSRFVSSAEAICFSGIGNLEKIVDLLTGVRDINIADVKRKIAKFEKETNRSASDERQLLAFREREKIYDSVQKQVGELLAENEDALTALNGAAVAAARIKSDIGRPEIVHEMEVALDDLKRLATRYNGEPQKSLV